MGWHQILHCWGKLHDGDDRAVVRKEHLRPHVGKTLVWRVIFMEQEGLYPHPSFICPLLLYYPSFICPPSLLAPLGAANPILFFTLSHYLQSKTLN